MTHLKLLENSNWFTQYQTHPHIIYAQSTQPNSIPDITSVCIKQWKAEIKDQERSIAQSRLNMLNNEHQQSLYKISTLTQDDILNILVPKTENIQQTNTIMPVLNSINLNITPGFHL